MSLHHLKVDAIDEETLKSLAFDAVAESKTLEFKETLVYFTADQKVEFVSDMTALANTDGGDLVYGLRSEKGIATEVVGLRNHVPDDVTSKIENLLRDFVQPRLTGVQIRSVPLSSGDHALIVRVPRSYASPHMVRYQGVTRFCGRNANGKYDLDVTELRSAFLSSETLSDRLKAFRIDRVNRLASGSATVSLSGNHLLVLHLLPLVSIRADAKMASQELFNVLSGVTPRPMATYGWTPMMNFDGLLVSSTAEINGEVGSYVQVFRNGFIESVDSLTLEPKQVIVGGEPVPIIPSIAWEERLLEVLPGYISALEKLKLSPPFVLSLSLINVRGYTMYVNPTRFQNATRSVDRDHLLTDEILVEDVSQPASTILRPLFDQVWNACGWKGSINYDANGTWRHHS